MNRLLFKLSAPFFCLAFLLFGLSAGFSFDLLAQEKGEGVFASNGAEPWGIGLLPAATPVMEKLYAFHNKLLLPIIVIICLFVLVLILWVCFRFRESANPVPSQITHNTWLEVAWTAVPAMILIVIAFPSFIYLYYMDRAEDADMTLKVTGYQWYWGYEYPDNGNLQFDAYMIPDGEEVDTPRLLGTDNRVVVPSDTTIRVLVTGGDVIHSWAVPSFGVKTDAIPGRNNETWFRVPAGKEGVYYGQCSEICGINHSFMPIMVEVVSKKEFENWVIRTRESLAFNRKVSPYSVDRLLSSAGRLEVETPVQVKLPVG